MRPFLSYYSALLWATCHAFGPVTVAVLEGSDEVAYTYDPRLQILWGSR